LTQRGAVYVANQADNTVSVIKVDTSASPPTNKVTDTVEVGKNPIAVAVDRVTHKVYVANTDDKTVSVIEPR
jgi:YVTN family beta-propeller protein